MHHLQPPSTGCSKAACAHKTAVQVTELRKRTADLPDDYFVVLIGDLVTEEALPTYMAMLNTLDGVRDETGAAPTPWARWWFFGACMTTQTCRLSCRLVHVTAKMCCAVFGQHAAPHAEQASPLHSVSGLSCLYPT